jgi:class 3 adenylate cyclase
MLREYSEAKKYLFGERRKLAFLSIDVVGSTKMKIGEDKLSIEHAFSEYKKFVERILKKNAIWKVAWTPDGIMCAFHNTEDAVKAGQDVLTGLPWFNDGIHQLKTPFNVRCGVNAGEVVFPEDKAMEEISDEVIDVAGHMQKYAAHGALWLSSDVLTELVEKSAFREITVQKVDGHTAWEWRADDLGDTAPRGACTPTEH